MKHLLKHNKPYIPLIIGVIFALCLQAYMNLTLPNIMSDIVNVGIQGYTSQIETAVGAEKEALIARQQSYILKTGLKMLGVSVLVSLAGLLSQFFSARWGAGLSRDLRKTVFTKIESFSGVEFDKFSTASLITRTTNDINAIQMITTMGMRMMIFAPIMGFGAIFMAVKKAPSMAWINALCVLLVACVMTIMFKVVSPKFLVIQKIVDKLNLIARESLSGLLVVRAFSTQKYEQERYDETNREFKEVNLFVNRATSLLNPAMGLFNTLLPVLIVWVGAGRIAHSELLVGDMMAFIQYSANIMQAFMMVSSMFVMAPRALVSLKRIGEVLDTENEITEKENTIPVLSDRCSVEFKEVSFAYPNSDGYAIEDISFTVNPGEITAVIGSTGCGKTSMVNLIPRLYDVSKGSVSINGVDVRDMAFDNLRSLIGYVPQKSSLLSGTINSNMLRVKPDATQEEIKKACEIAQAADFIEKLPERYDAPVSAGGSNFSGGQKQRLCIARAVLKKSPIYIFDDSFSALDFTTDLNLRKALKENLSDSAIIIIGQRVSSIMNSEQIIVMDEGKIVGKGTHGELLKTCEQYREIAYSQLEEEV